MLPRPEFPFFPALSRARPVTIHGVVALRRAQDRGKVRGEWGVEACPFETRSGQGVVVENAMTRDLRVAQLPNGGICGLPPVAMTRMTRRDAVTRF